MTRMTKAHWKQFADQWRRAGPELARVHRNEVRTRPYDPDVIDDLLRIGDAQVHSRKVSGLVELQRYLLKLAQLRGAAPRAVHEERSKYGS